MILQCNKCFEDDFKTTKLLRFHQKYNCQQFRYESFECMKCGNVYTKQCYLDKHQHKHNKKPDIKKLKKALIGDLWNIVFEYITKENINLKRMCECNDSDILNCIYIKGNFSINSERNIIHTVIPLSLKLNRRKLIETCIKNFDNYVPTILEYNMMMKSNISIVFIRKYMLSNLHLDKKIALYIVEDIIINVLSKDCSRRHNHKYCMWSLKVVIGKIYKYFKDDVRVLLETYYIENGNSEINNYIGCMLNKKFINI